MILFALIIWVGWELIKGLVYKNQQGGKKTRPFSIFGTSNRGNIHQSEKPMGLFDKFKKKQEPDYDPNNIGIRDLRVGFMLDYDLQTWIVKEEYEYDWGDNYFTREYMLETAEDVAYLHIDYNDEDFMTISRKLKVRALGEDIPEVIVKDKRPPKKILFQGTEYLLDKESPGYFSDDPEDDESWTELISWDYFDADGKLTACVEQWGEREFEASHGKVVQSFEITNILPATV